jgi:hypothetical protein
MASVLVVLAVMLPAAQYASAPPADAGHHASLRHASRIPVGTARLAIGPDIASSRVIVLRPVVVGFTPGSDTPPFRPLPVPFVPPRG